MRKRSEERKRERSFKRCVVLNVALFHQSGARFQMGKILSKTICKSRLPRRLP